MTTCPHDETMDCDFALLNNKLHALAFIGHTLNLHHLKARPKCKRRALQELVDGLQSALQTADELLAEEETVLPESA